MIILAIRVSNIGEIIMDFDQMRVYRDATQDAAFSDPAIGTIQLVATQTDYEYDDPDGQQTDWYTITYYNSTDSTESEKSLPFQGIPAEGPLGLLTPDYIRANTDFPALAAMTDAKLWNYIWRAEALIYSWGQQYGGFCVVDKPNWNVMARIAAQMVVEQLYITNNPIARARRVSGVQSERIGSYSYTLQSGSANYDMQTANNPYAFGAEPLAILGYYTCGTSSLVHMKATQVFVELAPIAGYPLTPQYVGVEVRPWHDYMDLELMRGVMFPGSLRLRGYNFGTKDPA